MTDEPLDTEWNALVADGFEVAASDSGWTISRWGIEARAPSLQGAVDEWVGRVQTSVEHLRGLPVTKDESEGAADA